MDDADQTLMSGAQLSMREDVGLSDGEVEVLAGSMNVFMLPSILAAGWVADRLGRRPMRAPTGWAARANQRPRRAQASEPSPFRTGPCGSGHGPKDKRLG